MDAHRPVLLDEALAGLAIRPEGIYVDCTFGRGGHSGAILERLGDEGRLIALDRDPDAVEKAEEIFAADPRFAIFRSEFGQIAELLETQNINMVDGILMDLGVSSPQLDDPARGFSFSADGPLDMRMSKDRGEPAAQWLARADEREIAQVIFRYGEERASRRIARAIVKARSEAPLTRTAELAEIVESVMPRREHRRRHPATKTFQAIRIFINRELEELERCLAQGIDLLAREGRLCSISFHSLEDRIVKRFMRENARPDPVYAGLPDMPAHAQPKLRLVGKAIHASDEEQSINPRSRSAVLRIAERLA